MGDSVRVGEVSTEVSVQGKAVPSSRSLGQSVVMSLIVRSQFEVGVGVGV